MPKIRDVRFMYKEDPNNKRWAEDKSRFGFKLLEKMGWKEGDGLGKKRDGMTEHVKAVWKTDTTGLGAKEETKKKRTVSDKTSSFSDVLNKLKEQYNTVDNVDDNKEKKKKKKKESKKDANNEEETKNEETNEEPKETPVEKKKNEEKKEVKRVHHKRRARSKMTKNYSKEDLAAIMGNNPLKLKEEKMMNKDNNNSIRNEEGQPRQRDVNVSSVSTATYFSRKLSEMKLNQPNEVDDEGNEEPTIMEEDAAVIIQKEEVKEESEVVNNEEEEERQRKLEKEERKRKRREKKEKKEKKRKQKEEEEQQE
ncbi:hypothetical protein ABK040_008988 [Willaertia magna]